MPVAFAAIVAENSLDAHQHMWRTARQLGSNMSRAVSEEIGRTLESLDVSLRAVVDNEQLPEVRQLDTKMRNRVLFGRSVGAKNLSTILVLDASGHVLVESRTGQARDGTYADREYFRVQRDNPNAGLFISAPYKGRYTPEWLFAISRRLKGANDTFVGAVAGTVRLAPIQAFIQSLNLGPHGSFSVVRDDGTVMMRIPYRDADLGTSVRQGRVFQRSLVGREGQFIATSIIDGVRRLHSFHRIDGTSLIVIASLALVDIEAGWWHHTLVVGCSTVLVIISLVVSAALLTRELRRREAAEGAALQAEAEARKSASLFRLLAENSSDMVSRIGSDSIRQYVSPACRQILGREPEDLVGHSPQEQIHPDDWDTFNAVRERLSAGASQEEKLTYRVKHANGAWIWIESTVRTVFNPATHERDGVVAVSRDITERKLMESELARLASLDGLTGLANRRTFDARIENEWQRCARYEQPLSLLLLDVDKFKTLNDHYGHQYGDECLRQIGALIGDAVRRANDVSARYGGEEFAILLPETDAEGAGAVAERVRYEIQGLALPNARAADTGIVTVSVGVATVRPQPGASLLGPADLIKMADGSLYAAKQAGRNQVMQSGNETLSSTL